MERDRLAAHPDLDSLGRRLRHEMDEVLRAEQHAARVSARRRATIRDRFLLAEDRVERLAVELESGSTVPGTVIAVGADHVVLSDGGHQCLVSLRHVVAVRRPRR